MSRRATAVRRNASAAALFLSSFAHLDAAAQSVSVGVAAPSGPAALGSVGASLVPAGLSTNGSLYGAGASVSLTPSLGLAPSLAPTLSAPAAAGQAAVSPSGVSASVTLPSRSVAVKPLHAAFGVSTRLAAPAAAKTAGVSAEDGSAAMTPAAASLAAFAERSRGEGVSRDRGGDLSLGSARLGTLFDGSLKTRASIVEPSVAAKRFPSAASGLKPALGTAPGEDKTPKASVPSPEIPKTAPKSGSATVWQAIAAAALLLGLPTLALVLGPAAPTAVSALAWLGAIHPLASALAAGAGAVYGLITAHKKAGGAPSAGVAMASMLRWGMLAGASIYVLFDLTQLVFLGAGGVLSPLSSAVATAALAQGAFQERFVDPASSPADRVMTAFPAVAGALGLSVGVLLSAATPLVAGVVSALAATGFAAAVFSALYTPGRSPAGAPAKMTKGFVLQALMSGVAIAAVPAWLVTPFMLLAAVGMTLSLSAAVETAIAALPESFRKRFRRG